MSDAELYGSLLLLKGYGYPLFNPKPFDDLPDECRRQGTKIGDVGIVTLEGSFDPIFNILRPDADPANRFGVPEDFEPLSLNPLDIAEQRHFHRCGSHISNTTIKKRRLDVDCGIEGNVFYPLGAGAVVEVSTSSKQTALLMLPDGASRWDLRYLQAFRDYAIKHAHSWYEFVNLSLRRMLGNGDLYLVTGVTKSTSWSVAAVENQAGDASISFKLKAAQVGNAGASFGWEWDTSSSGMNSGPAPREEEALWKDNQTVFLRGFKVAIRRNPLKRAPKVTSIVKSSWSDLQRSGSFGSFARFGNSVHKSSPPRAPGSSTSSMWDRKTSSTASQLSEDSWDDVQSFNSVAKIFHPSTEINEFLLEKAPSATVAVTHDHDWMGVLRDDDEGIPDAKTLIERLKAEFMVKIGQGGVFFDPWLHTEVKVPVYQLRLRASTEEHESESLLESLRKWRAQKRESNERHLQPGSRRTRMLMAPAVDNWRYGQMQAVGGASRRPGLQLGAAMGYHVRCTILPMENVSY